MASVVDDVDDEDEDKIDDAMPSFASPPVTAPGATSSTAGPSKTGRPSLGWIGAGVVGLLIAWQNLIAPALGFASAPNAPGQRYGAICRDGWHSTATGSGACSHHGGVDHWLVGATAPEASRAPLIRWTLRPTRPGVSVAPFVSGVRIGAICADGTRSSATGSGACSHHGGVSSWLAP